MKHDLPTLKDKLLIPEVWQRLGLPGTPKRCCQSPLRKDRLPSFSIYDGGRRWKDHATGEGGDVIDFIAAACHLDRADAVARFLTLAGAFAAPMTRLCQPRLKPSTPTERAPLHLPPVHRGSEAELATVAQVRLLDPEAVSLAQSLRTLAFGEVCGHASWMLGDDTRRIVEARRMDGLLYPQIGALAERKAHTLRGSQKAWPVGTAVLQRLPTFRAVMLVEGGPDYLAALHFGIQFDRWDILPIAMLGRSAGTRIAPEALELLRGRPVRIYPHDDPDGGGLTSAQTWAAQLHAYGCPVDIFNFNGLRRHDGTPINDLNDLVHLHPEQQHHLQHLLP